MEVEPKSVWPQSPNFFHYSSLFKKKLVYRVRKCRYQVCIQLALDFGLTFKILFKTSTFCYFFIIIERETRGWSDVTKMAT